ncbi:MAG: D-glycero-beta-D-manno-heptose-7-phosphate kinase, partial [Vicinamibacterales bacterium]
MMSLRSAQHRLAALVDEFAGIRVAVFGDLLADEFIYGQISRVSREAPVLILEYDSTEIVPGGAGNAANNVAALGGTAIAIGVAGEDEPG